MGIIQGFYQLRAYNNSSYKVHYPRSGSPVMRTQNNDVNNYQTWMLWQPSDTDASYVQLISATNVLDTNYSVYDSLNDGSEAFNIYRQPSITSSNITIQTDTLDFSKNASGISQFIKTKKATATVNNVSCDVVTFQHCYTKKYLDCSKAISNQSNSLTLETSSENDTQKFILEPINPYYDKLVAPSSIYLQSAIGSTALQINNWYIPMIEKYYWQWTNSENTIIAEDCLNYSERDATLNNSGTWSYGNWTYLNVSPSDLKTIGYKSWQTSPTTIPQCSTSIKQVAKQIRIATVRKLTAYGKTITFYSTTASQTIYFAKIPNLNYDGLSWTPEGMKVNISSDYFGQGSMKLKFTSVTSDLEEILSTAYEVSVVKDTTITIPTANFKRPPNEGDTLRLTFLVDTDVYAPGNWYESILGILSYDAGNVDVTPTVTEIDGFRYKVDVPYANTVKVWLSVNGENTLLDGTVSGGHTIYEVIPPFCTDYAIFVSYENSDKTKWGTAYVEMPKINIRAHAFTWSGGSVVIWLNKDTALTESFTFSPQSTTHTLAGRSHDVVTYLSDGEKNYTSVKGDIKGYIVPQLETYGTTKESIEKMVEQGHVLYRAPYGRVCNVAVTGADITTDVGITEVSISIVQEDDD